MGFLPADMTIEDMCEARRSYKTFDVIDSGFPWERGKLTTPNGPESNLWVIRRNMIHYIDTHGGTMIQSGKFSIAHDAKKTSITAFSSMAVKLIANIKCVPGRRH